MTNELLSTTDSNTTFARRSELLLSFGLLAVIVVLLVPLPSVILDMLLAMNLAFSVLLLLVTLSANNPLEISAFPSMLLLLTLYRLSLNVATTRLILLEGDAGRIVSTFGGMIVGGSLVVGIVIFLILVIIQFIVITKGASRISEVNARFVLDAMPGKQMAIDAELNAGSIDDVEAKEKRDTLTREAEFYGAMDGAGKYVRGDAIAGLIITLVNVVGGVVFAMSNGVAFNEALQIYSTLTIGDGLVTQIPALIIATTAGILVTKASSGTSLGHEVGMQMLNRRSPLMVATIILVAFGLVPGLPVIPFFALAAGTAYFWYTKGKKPPPQEATQESPTSPTEPGTPEEVGLDEFVNTDRICLKVGPGLFPMIQSSREPTLVDRIASLRRDMANKFGFWIPTVRVRDNLLMESDQYELSISGRVVGRGRLKPAHLLAINPGTTSLEIEGEDTTEPAFGLPAKWITNSSRQRAELAGYTVVDSATVMITHLGEMLRKRSHELLSREDLQKMLDKVRESSPTLIDEIKPEVVRMALLRRVLVDLLQERVSICSLELVLESAVHHGPTHKTVEDLCDHIRQDIGHLICERFQDESGNVRVIVIEPQLEAYLRESLDEGRLMLQPNPLERLIAEIRQAWEPMALQEKNVAVLVDFGLRRALRGVLERSLPDVPVIAYTEIPSELMIEPVTIIRAENVMTDNGPAAAETPARPGIQPVIQPVIQQGSQTGSLGLQPAA